MKLVINYDLIDSICNGNEPISPFKIVRNRKYDYFTFQFPIFTFFNFCTGYNVPEMIGVVGLQLGMAVCLDLGFNFEHRNKIEIDNYAKQSLDNLKKLVG